MVLAVLKLSIEWSEGCEDNHLIVSTVFATPFPLRFTFHLYTASGGLSQTLIILRNEFNFWNFHGIMSTSVSCKVSEALLWASR